MAKGPIYIERHGPIAHIVLNRPEKRNALTLAMWKALGALAAELDGDPTVKVVIVRGVDAAAFAAGADIDEFQTVYATPETGLEYTLAMAAAEARLSRLSKPTIALIQGPCIGAGCAIALSCDMRFADHTAKFCVPPARLGLVYSLADTKRLVDAVGAAKAKDMLFTAKVLKADEAMAIGLVDCVLESENLASHTNATARSICSVSGMSTSAAKKIIQMIQDGVTDDNKETRAMFMDAFSGKDFSEGRAAFIEKRRPKFE